jgi:hypothetical protein
MKIRLGIAAETMGLGGERGTATHLPALPPQGGAPDNVPGVVPADGTED